MPDGKQLFVISPDTVSPNPVNDVAFLSLCSHEEADTRILVHVADAARSGHSRVGICIVDTDVVVLAISLVQTIPDITELWIHFGTGRNYRHTPAHQIAQSLVLNDQQGFCSFMHSQDVIKYLIFMADQSKIFGMLGYLMRKSLQYLAPSPRPHSNLNQTTFTSLKDSLSSCMTGQAHKQMSMHPEKSCSPK